MITSGTGLGAGRPALQSPLVRVLLDDVVVVHGHRVLVDDVFVHQSRPRFIVFGYDLRGRGAKQKLIGIEANAECEQSANLCKRLHCVEFNCVISASIMLPFCICSAAECLRERCLVISVFFKLISRDIVGCAAFPKQKAS